MPLNKISRKLSDRRYVCLTRRVSRTPTWDTVVLHLVTDTENFLIPGKNIYFLSEAKAVKIIIRSLLYILDKCISHCQKIKFKNTLPNLFDDYFDGKSCPKYIIGVKKRKFTLESTVETNVVGEVNFRFQYSADIVLSHVRFLILRGVRMYCRQMTQCIW